MRYESFGPFSESRPHFSGIEAKTADFFNLQVLLSKYVEVEHSNISQY